jgi:hypothetical protein
MHLISTIPGRIDTVSYSVFCVPFPMYTIPPGRVRFGAFELDLSTGELRSNEAPDPDNTGPNNKVLLFAPEEKTACAVVIASTKSTSRVRWANRV